MRESIRTALAGFCLVVLLGACAGSSEISSTPTVSTHYDRSYDFSRVHKIAIQPISRTAVSTIGISDAQISRIDAALTVELQRRGFQIVPDNAEADMFLVWHLITDARMDVQDLNSISQYNCLNCAPGDSAQTPKYVEGTFVVEMIDPIRLQSEWRATLVSRMLYEPDPKLSEQSRQEAAEAVFADFPPRPSTP